MGMFTSIGAVENRRYTFKVSGDASVVSASYVYPGAGADKIITLYTSSGATKIINMKYEWVSGFTYEWRYHSPYAGTYKTFTLTYGAGDVFKLKNLPTAGEEAGLESGQVYRDGTTLKIKL